MLEVAAATINMPTVLLLLVAVLLVSQADGRTWPVVVHERRRRRWQEEAQCTISSMVKVIESIGVSCLAMTNDLSFLC